MPDTTFTFYEKTDPNDRVTVEVGDAKQTEFLPQAKIMRWDNEANVSIRLKDYDLSKASVSQSAGKVEYCEDKKEAHFYSTKIRIHTADEELRQRYTIEGECNDCHQCCEDCIDFQDGKHSCDLENRPDHCSPMEYHIFRKRFPKCSHYLVERKEPIEVEPTGEEIDALEFEIILKEKPDKNVVEFTLNTKGVRFWYQPELTQKEIEEGHWRPENVVGSYAIYTTDEKRNIAGQKNYGIGKVGHIFRPKIVDAAGRWAWGELNINGDILSVTIPQDFLDSASYPVRHAAGLTFGYTTGGASCTDLSNSMAGSVFTGVAGTGIGICAKVICSADKYFKYGIYTHSDSSLLTNGTCNELTGSIQSGTMISSCFTSPPTISAVDYVLVMFHNGPSTDAIYYDSGDTNQGHTMSSTYSSGFPSTATFTHNNNKYSIYCTYTTGSKYENYTSGGTLDWDANNRAQTFTPSVSHTVTHVKLQLKRASTSTSGTLTVGIYATSSGLPTGSALCSGTILTMNVNPNAYAWYFIDMGAGAVLTAGTMYAIVLTHSAMYVTNELYVACTASGAYSGGTGCDKGASQCTGGTATVSGIYTRNTFTADGTFTPYNTVTNGLYPLVVAGGGAGGSDLGGGGGGAGGVPTPAVYSCTGSSGITVTIGAGGTGVAGASGNSGGNSVFGTVTATGGGGGAKNAVGKNGGSGGGGSRESYDEGIFYSGGTGSQGSSGGRAKRPGGGGGGGKGGAGVEHFYTGDIPNGGAGYDASAFGITANSGYVAGGGGGSMASGETTGIGTGQAGGGNGGRYATSTAGTAAAANSGSGGGGYGAGTGTGLAGGSGIVVVKYVTSSQTGTTWQTNTDDMLFEEWGDAILTITISTNERVTASEGKDTRTAFFLSSPADSMRVSEGIAARVAEYIISVSDHTKISEGYTLRQHFYRTVYDQIKVTEQTSSGTEFNRSVADSLSLVENTVDAYPRLPTFNCYRLYVGNTYQHTAQCFYSRDAAKVTFISYPLARNGSPTGNAYAKFYAVSGTPGIDAKPTGDPLATSNGVDVSSISTTTDFVQFTFPSAVSLSAGTWYFVAVVYNEGGDSNNYIGSWYNGNNVHQGSLAYGVPPSTWTAYGLRDIPFFVYSQVVKEEFSLAVSDTLSFTEQASGAISIFRSVSDAISICDSVSAREAFFLSVSDHIKATEAVAEKVDAYVINNSEHFSITEGINAAIAFFISATQPLKVSEGIAAKIAEYIISVSDSYNVTDTATTGIVSQVSVTDSIIITEEIAAQVASYNIKVVDAFRLETCVMDGFEPRTHLLGGLIYLTNSKIAQCFQAKESAAILSAAFKVCTSGTPTGNAYAKLYTVSGTPGTNAVPAVELASSDPIDVSQFPNGFPYTYMWFTVNFSTPYTLTKDTWYFISLEYTGGSFSDCVKVQYTTDNVHAGNIAQLTGFPVPSWIPAVYDCGFKVYYSQVNEEFNLSVANAYKITDIADSATNFYINVNDSISVSEAVSTYWSTRIAVSDQAKITESISSQIAYFGINTSDSIHCTEVVSESAVHFINVNDHYLFTESTTTNLVAFNFNLQVVNTLHIGESVAVRVTAYIVSVADQYRIAEQVSIAVDAYRVNAADAIRVTEVANAATALRVQVSEFITLSELSTGVEEHRIDASSSYRFSENAAVVEAWQINRTDVVRITEAVSSIISYYEIAVADQYRIAEQEMVTLGDLLIIGSQSISYTEVIAARPDDYRINVADSCRITEARIPVIAWQVVTADSYRFTEQVGFVSTKQVAAADSFRISEQAVAATVLHIVSTDPVKVSESIAAQIDSYKISVTDRYSFTEVASGRVYPYHVSIDSYLKFTEAVQTRFDLFISTALEPILDKDGNPILDENGNPIYEDWLVGQTLRYHDAASAFIVGLVTDKYINLSYRLSIRDAASARVAAYIVSASDYYKFSEAVAAKIDAYKRSVADSYRISDAASAGLSFHISVSDRVLHSESIAARMSDFEVSVADHYRVSEQDMVSMGDFLIIDYQPIHFSELLQVKISDYILSVADSLKISEQRTPSIAWQLTAADGIHYSEVATGAEVFHITVSDRTSISETASAALMLFIQAMQPCRISESITAATSTYLSIADTLKISEGISAKVDAYKLVAADHYSIVDSVTAAIAAYKVSVADAVLITEVLAASFDAYNINVADHCKLSEQASLATMLRLSVADSYRISELVTAATGFYITVSDHYHASEDDAASLAWQINCTDSYRITEQTASRMSDFAVSVADHYRITPQEMVTLGDLLIIGYQTISFSELVAAKPDEYRINASDPIHFSENRGVVIALQVTASDQYRFTEQSIAATMLFLSVSDLVHVTTEQATVREVYFLAASDAYRVSESGQGIISFYEVGVSDSIRFAEAIAAKPDDYRIAVSDSIRTSEVVSAAFIVFDYSLLIGEAVSITDAASVLQVYTIDAQDALQISEVLDQKISTYEIQVADHSRITDLPMVTMGNLLIMVQQTVSYTEAIAARPDDYQLSVADTIRFTEVFSEEEVIFDRYITVADTIRFSEQRVAAVDAYKLSVADSIRYTEQGAAAFYALSLVGIDSLRYSDASQWAVDSYRSVTDRITISDAASTATVLRINVESSILFSESAARAFTFSIAAEDHVTYADGAGAARQLNISATDVLHYTESIAAFWFQKDYLINRTDQIRITEEVLVTSLGINQINATDHIHVTDAVAARTEFFLSVAESLSSTEGRNLQQYDNAAVADHLSISDRASAAVELFLAVEDSVTVAEDAIATHVYTTSVADTLSFSEDSTGTISLNVRSTDSITFSELVGFFQLREVGVFDSIVFVDRGRAYIYIPATGLPKPIFFETHDAHFDLSSQIIFRAGKIALFKSDFKGTTFRVQRKGTFDTFEEHE